MNIQKSKHKIGHSIAARKIGFMENGNISRKTKKVTFLIIAVTLVVNVVLTGINVYLIARFYQYSPVFTPNFTYISNAIAEDTNLGKPIIYFGHEGIIEHTVHQGSTYATIWVITPHYGILSIRIKDFNVIESEYLNRENQNKTKISYVDEEETRIYVPLVPGSNNLRVELPLKVHVYPESEKLPQRGESIKILLGYLYLEAEVFDFETQNNITRDFSAKIFIELDRAL